jgi:hypothetical protein
MVFPNLCKIDHLWNKIEHFQIASSAWDYNLAARWGHVHIPSGRFPNPPFNVPLRRMGFTNLPSFSTMAAVTFCDVVVSHQPFTDGLLFHELVHVEQYRQLGTPSFAELYVRGFVSGGGYDGIPLEINAYDLSGKFERSPRARFSVADEVGAWIREGRF